MLSTLIYLLTDWIFFCLKQKLFLVNKLNVRLETNCPCNTELKDCVQSHVLCVMNVEDTKNAIVVVKNTSLC